MHVRRWAGAGTIVMSLNPDGVPAGFYHQAGATAYLIDPAGAYSPAAASAPRTHPAGPDDWAGASAPRLAAAAAYIPIIGATSVAAEIVDPKGAYRSAGASAPTTDPAATDGGAGASAPTLAAAGASIPITWASSAAAAIVELADKYNRARASAPTIDPADSRGAAGAPTVAALGEYIPVTEATSAAAEIVSPHGAYLPPVAT